MKNLYLLKRIGEVNWEEYRGFVICARSDYDARQIANEREDIYNDGDGTWIDNDKSTCRRIATNANTKVGIILSDLKEG